MAHPDLPYFFAHLPAITILALALVVNPKRILASVLRHFFSRRLWVLGPFVPHLYNGEPQRLAGRNFIQGESANRCRHVQWDRSFHGPRKNLTATFGARARAHKTSTNDPDEPYIMSTYSCVKYAKSGGAKKLYHINAQPCITTQILQNIFLSDKQKDGPPGNSYALLQFLPIK